MGHAKQDRPISNNQVPIIFETRCIYPGTILDFRTLCSAAGLRHDSFALEIWQAESISGDAPIDESQLVANFTPQESAPMQAAKISDYRRREWLLGRIAVKQAVSGLVARVYQIKIAAADIVILNDQRGCPHIDRNRVTGLPHMPQLSIAHTKGIAVAAALDGGHGIFVGIDIERVRPLEDGFARVAFAPAEHKWFSHLKGPAADECMIKMWCAKEAAAKALGLGFQGKPRSYVVTQLAMTEGCAEVEYVEEQRRVPVSIAELDNLMLAVAIFPDMHQQCAHRV